MAILVMLKQIELYLNEIKAETEIIQSIIDPNQLTLFEEHDENSD